jgi:hypothetical protein
MGKPEGAGYVEASIADRKASMSNISANVKPENSSKGFMPIGTKAGTAYGYKPEESAAETAPRIGGGS